MELGQPYVITCTIFYVNHVMTHSFLYYLFGILMQLQRKLDAVRCLNKPLSDDERRLRMRLEGVHRDLAPPQQMLKDLNSALLQVHFFACL